MDIRYNLPFACLCLAPFHMHSYKWMLLKYRKSRKTYIYRTLCGVNCHDDANCSRTTDFLSYCNGLLKILQRLGLQICSVARQRAKKFSASRGLRTPDLIHYTLAMCPKTAHDPPFTAEAAPPPFRPGNPALCGSRPLVTPYNCRLGDLLCYTCMLYLFNFVCVMHV